MPRTHLAIVDSRFSEALLSGAKRIETRFSRTRRAPFGSVSAGDVIYFKESGGDIIGRSQALSVVEYEQLTPAKIEAIRRRHNHAIQAPSDYWESHIRAQYCVLIRLGSVSNDGWKGPAPRQYGAGWILL